MPAGIDSFDEQGWTVEVEIGGFLIGAASTRDRIAAVFSDTASDALVVVDTEAGTSRTTDLPEMSGTAFVAFDGDRVFVVGKTDDGYVLTTVDADGNLGPIENSATGPAELSSLVVFDDTVLVEYGSRVDAYDTSDLTLKWDESGWPCVSDDLVWITGEDSAVGYTSDGNAAAGPVPVNEGLSVARGDLVFSFPSPAEPLGPGQAYSVETGELLWETSPTARATANYTGSMGAGLEVLVGDTNLITSYDPESGEVLWTVVAYPRSAIHLDGTDRLVVATAGVGTGGDIPGVRVVERGATLATISAPAEPQSFTVADGVVYAMDDEILVVADLNSGDEIDRIEFGDDVPGAMFPVDRGLVTVTEMPGDVWVFRRL